ncbi:hypothetical protein DRQ09_07935 [candidate division KSB1 bacterium]|nr:MAG: hypothetical protein DRQ09_07935 [candidate division KSB1 bacterium]
MKKIMEIIPVVAKSKSRVLIRGEIGTEKNIIARMIHNLSDYRRLPFISFYPFSLNKTAINEKDILKKIQAEKDISVFPVGTLYFKDIEDLNLENQLKIYSLFQKWENEGVNFRVITSIKKNIWDKIDKGNFIEELYYYLNVIHIYIPPLRERLEDIQPLVEYLSKKICEKLNREPVYFPEEEISKLYKLKLKGNMLEIANLIERAIVLNPDGEKRLKFIDLYLQDIDENKSIELEKDLSKYKDDFLKKTIIDAIRKNKGVKKEAAKDLGISPRALSYYVSKYNI